MEQRKEIIRIQNYWTVKDSGPYAQNKLDQV